jgi:hypothetical protein
MKNKLTRQYTIKAKRSHDTVLVITDNQDRAFEIRRTLGGTIYDNKKPRLNKYHTYTVVDYDALSSPQTHLYNVYDQLRDMLPIGSKIYAKNMGHYSRYDQNFVHTLLCAYVVRDGELINITSITAKIVGEKRGLIDMQTSQGPVRQLAAELGWDLWGNYKSLTSEEI